MASMILGSVGSALLGPIGGFIGSAIGSFIDNLLFAPKPPDIEGPRLEDLSAIRADPGVPIPLLWGADRIPGIVMASTDLIETRHKNRVGGKGGKKQTQISYTYHVDIDFLLCEGPILGVSRIWADGKLIRGTRYQLQVDTDENFEQTGGIPYSAWYKNNVYPPADVWWSYNPTYNPGITDLAAYYLYDASQDLFTEITEAEAMVILEDENDVRVVYQQDTVRNKMLPVPLSHDYTGECLEEEAELPPPPPGYTYEPTVPVLQGWFSPLNWREEGLVSRGTAIDLAALGVPIGDDDAGAYFSEPPGVKNVVATVAMRFSTNSSSGTQSPLTAISLNPRDSAGLSDPRYVQTRGSDGAGTRTESKTDWIIQEIGEGHRWLEYSFYMARNNHRLAVGSTTAEIVVTWTENGSANAQYRDWPDYYNFYDAINDWSPISVLAFCGYSEGVAVYRGKEEQIADPTMELVYDEVPCYTDLAHIVFQRLELEFFGNRIPNLTFEVVQSDDARIRHVITDLMNRAEVDPKYYDITALPETGLPSYVLGYSVATQTSLRAAMEPILELFEIDAAEIGNQIVFRPKNRSYDHTIDYKDLAAVETGSGPDPLIKLTFRDVMEMPRSLGIRYRDPEREYQPNTGNFSRQIGPSIQNSLIEYPAVIESGRAKRLARDKIRDLWRERSTGAWTIPHKYLYISPTDIVYIDGEPYGASSYTFKVTKVERGSNGVLSMEGVLRDQELYVPLEGERDRGTTTDNTWADGPNSQTTTNVIQGTVMEFMDLPPLRAVDDNLRYYLALAGNSDSWPGGEVYRAYDGAVGPYESVAASYVPAVIGSVEAADGGLLPIEQKRNIDFESRVTIKMLNPTATLASCTVAEFFNNTNVALIGDEIVCFLNATDQGNGIWVLDTFLRGRLDTEYAMTTHTANERFVLLDIGAIQEGENTDASLNTELPYKPVTFGLTPASVAAQNHTNTGARKRPFAPVFIGGTRDGSDNLTITWTRQNRISFDIVDSTDIPLSEDAESYELEIRAEDTDTGAAVRTETLSSPTYTYTAADQTSDGFTPGDLYTVHIYQISATVGRGNRGRAIV